MAHRIAPIVAAACLPWWASGCTVYTSTSATASAGAGASSGGGGGVTVVETRCVATETCNGLDDDCDGVIDEGCGYDTGAIQVTLGWGPGVDLDLYVIDPAGQTLSYRQTATATGGRLDQDARGACEGGRTTENVFWPTGANPPSGTYRVEVHYWGDCDTGAGPVTANLSIAAGGRVIGAYAVDVPQGRRVPVASFTIE